MRAVRDATNLSADARVVQCAVDAHFDVHHLRCVSTELDRGNKVEVAVDVAFGVEGQIADKVAGEVAVKINVLPFRGKLMAMINFAARD